MKVELVRPGPGELLALNVIAETDGDRAALKSLGKDFGMGQLLFSTSPPSQESDACDIGPLSLQVWAFVRKAKS